MSILVQPATPHDVGAILALIKELALFEREPHAVTVTEDVLQRDGFGTNPLYTCLVAKIDNLVVGISFCYIRYSTWKGPRLFLEDLIVTQAARGQGVGTALWKETIKLAKQKGCNALCWQVLDWNQLAIDFYLAKGARLNNGWLNMVLDV